METYWLRSSELGGLAILDVPEAIGAEPAMWSPLYGIPSHLVDDWVPGCVRVHFINGDPRAEQRAAEVARLHNEQRARRRREQQAAGLAGLAVLLDDE